MDNSQTGPCYFSFLVNNMTLLSLTITNSGDSGIAVTGYNNTLDSLSISNLGCGGIHLSGGEQVNKTLH